MTTISINNYPVISGDLLLPNTGNWSLQADVDFAETALSGSVVLSDGTNSFTGTVRKADVYSGRNKVLIVGGNNNLTKTLPGKSYSKSTFQNRVEDLLRETGENLDSIEPGGSEIITKWVRAKSTASSVLSYLTSSLDYQWRMLPNGKISVFRTLSFTTLSNPDIVETNRQLNNSRIEYALNNLAMLPGHQIGTFQFKTIHYYLDHSKIRSIAYV